MTFLFIWGFLFVVESTLAITMLFLLVVGFNPDVQHHFLVVGSDGTCYSDLGICAGLQSHVQLRGHSRGK